jgi:hypothetical protein
MRYMQKQTSTLLMILKKKDGPRRRQIFGVGFLGKQKTAKEKKKKTQKLDLLEANTMRAYLGTQHRYHRSDV